MSDRVGGLGGEGGSPGCVSRRMTYRIRKLGRGGFAALGWILDRFSHDPSILDTVKSASMRGPTQTDASMKSPILHRVSAPSDYLPRSPIGCASNHGGIAPVRRPRSLFTAAAVLRTEEYQVMTIFFDFLHVLARRTVGGREGGKARHHIAYIALKGSLRVIHLFSGKHVIRKEASNRLGRAANPPVEFGARGWSIVAGYETR